MSFDPATLFTPARSGGWYDPADPLTLWRDTAATSPVTTAGQSVARIDDKSGNGNHLLQSAAEKMPAWMTDANGKPYLQFDGVDDFLATSAAITLSLPFDRVTAIRQLSWSNLDRLFAIGNTCFLNQRPATPALNLHDGINDIVKTAALAVGKNGVVTERHVGGASQIAVNTGAYVTGNAGSTGPLGKFAIGADAAGASPSNIRFYGGVMRGGTMTDDEIAGLRAWLADRAGIVFRSRRMARHSSWI